MKNRLLKHAAVAVLAAASVFTGVSAANAAGTQSCTSSISDFQTGTPIAAGQKLLSGQHVDAHNSTLVMQGDGNLVVYLKAASGQQGPAVWSTGTWGAPGAYAIFQADGNFVLYGTDGGAMWSSNTWHLPGAHATLLDEGMLRIAGNQSTGGFVSGGFQDKSQYCMLNTTATGLPPHYLDSITNEDDTLVPGDWLDSPNAWLVFRPDGDMAIYRKRDNAMIWESGTAGRPYMSARMQGDGNFVLTSDGYLPVASTSTYNNPGAYATFQTDGNFVVYAANGSPLWSTNTWWSASQ